MTNTSVQRRLAAILAADVVAYSRLMQADEVGTLEALKAHRRELIDPVIASHRGRIVKTTGDGALVEFASVVDAVGCAVAIQRGMISRNVNLAKDVRIVFRLGINVGDIITTETISSGMASISPPAWKPCVSREGCASHARPMTKSGTSCRSPSPIGRAGGQEHFPCGRRLWARRKRDRSVA